MSNRLAAIYYDARTVGPGMSGVGRYALNLLTALAAREDAPPIKAFFRRECLPIAARDPGLARVEQLPAPPHTRHPAGEWWLHRTLPRSLPCDAAFFGAGFLVPGWRSRCAAARVAMIHDVFVFTHRQFFSARFGAWMRWSIRASCRGAQRIVVPAQTVREQIVRLGLAPSDKIDVTPEAPDATHGVWDEASRDAAAELIRRFEACERPPIMTIGTMDRRKDPQTARRAQIELRAAMGKAAPAWFWVGGAGDSADPSPPLLVADAARAGFAVAGHVAGVALPGLLRGSACYVSCSHTEGFGIPLVEAMTAGCPLVVTDTAIHREVAGDAALYFPAGDEQALARLLEQLLASPAQRAELIERGKARGAQFTWDRAAELTLDALRAATPLLSS